SVAFVPGAGAPQALSTGASGACGAPVPGLQPAMLQYVDALWPAPRTPYRPDGTALFFNVPILAWNGDFGVARMHHQIGEKIRLFVRYAVDDDSRVLPRQNPVFNDVTSARRQYSTIQLSQDLRP